MSLSVLNLVLRRSLGHWRLLLVVAIGVVVAAALTASTAIYSDAVRDLGLTFALRQVPKLKLDLDVENSSQLVRPREDGIRRQTVQSTTNVYAGKWIDGSVEYGKSSTFFLTPPDAAVPVDDQRPRAFFQYVQDLTPHIRIDEGQLKLHTDVAADPSQRPTVSAVVGKATADAFGIHVGDRFDLHPFWRLEAQPVIVMVTGIIEPKDLSEEYWFGKADRFSFPGTTWQTYPFFIDQQTMSQVLGGYLPDLTADISTFFFFKSGSVNANNATNANTGFRATMNQLQRQIERTTADSKLPDTIDSYQQKLFFTRLPLFALIMQVVGIVLYYIVMVSTMLVDRQAAEIALLKSRGASTGQVMLIYAIEGGIIALLGVIFGPPLASLVVKLLGPTPPFHHLADGHLLMTHVSVQAIWLAIGGSALSLLALLWPAFKASGFSLVQYRQSSSRPKEESAFTKYYLDVFLLLAGAMLFYELRQRGSLVTKQLFGSVKTDPLLLVTPALFTLMIALLFLRLFPVVLRLLVRA
ncbi:MAG: FtsX-like permease family protein, partial [Dehalococcoidia bacterium]